MKQEVNRMTSKEINLNHLLHYIVDSEKDPESIHEKIDFIFPERKRENKKQELTPAKKER